MIKSNNYPQGAIPFKVLIPLFYSMFPVFVVEKIDGSHGINSRKRYKNSRNSAKVPP
jgi:hypothetical protein